MFLTWLVYGYICFLLNDTATPEIYTYVNTLALRDALPICKLWRTSSHNVNHLPPSPLPRSRPPRSVRPRPLRLPSPNLPPGCIASRDCPILRRNLLHGLNKRPASGAL